ncbi:MAG: hypothetical protein ACLFQV_12630 [Vulcanimicrobiota bacterium]
MIKQKNTFLQIILLVLCFVLFPLMVSAGENITPETLWTIKMEDPKNEVFFPFVKGITFSGNGELFFVFEQNQRQPSRFLLFDAKTGKIRKVCELKEGVAEAFSVNHDGSKIFAIINRGKSAVEINTDSGNTREVYTKKPSGFRFTMPFYVNTKKDGRTWTTGYFLDEKRKNLGDYIVAINTNTVGEAKIEKIISFSDLLKTARTDGKIISALVGSKGKPITFIVAQKAESQHLYVLSDVKAEKARLVDGEALFYRVNLTENGNRVFYFFDDQNRESQLRMASTYEDKKQTLKTGCFNPPILSRTGEVLIAGVVTSNPIKQTIYFARENDGWKFHHLTTPEWDKQNTTAFYAITGDGTRFAIWGREQILVGEFKKK